MIPLQTILLMPQIQFASIWRFTKYSNAQKLAIRILICRARAGEKTSLALAYRLSLNTIVQKVSAGIKSNLLILDEPTADFSKEQLFKIREILDELKCPQVIRVSREKELESFADQVMKIEKQNGISQIKATWRPVLDLWVISPPIGQKDYCFTRRPKHNSSQAAIQSQKHQLTAHVYATRELWKWGIPRQSPKTLEETNSSKPSSNMWQTETTHFSL
jgi:hypothetical protein